MRGRQQGMSFITIILLLGLVGLGLKFSVVLVPPYLDYMTLDKSIKAMMRETQVDSQSPGDVRRALGSRFQINNIPDKMLDNLNITKDGNVTTIALDYEVRQSLIANIDVVVHFQHTYTSDKQPGVQ